MRCRFRPYLYFLKLIWLHSISPISCAHPTNQRESPYFRMRAWIGNVGQIVTRVVNHTIRAQNQLLQSELRHDCRYIFNACLAAAIQPMTYCALSFTQSFSKLVLREANLFHPGFCQFIPRCFHTPIITACIDSDNAQNVLILLRSLSTECIIDACTILRR